MKRKISQQVITANDLLSGEVVYLLKSGLWSPNHGEAIVFDDTSAAGARLADVHASDTSIVGAYHAAAILDDGSVPAPVHFREVFRTKGPSNRQLGKQTLAA